MTLAEIERSTWQAAARRDAELLTQTARRRSHGIVHTPPELARAVVRVADELVRERLGASDGLCGEQVSLIEPACGLGAFLAASLALAQDRGGDARVRGLGIDLDPLALRAARPLLTHPAARLRLVQADLLAGSALQRMAAEQTGLLVVLGNPPWTSARSQPTAAAQALLEDFRRDASGVRLPERKLGVLSDAYVRFFRVCAEAVRERPNGALLGLVSNASFLDGPVHRGMRAALMRWFDELFVLDLGGSALLGRAAIERDQNVFDVRPAVAVTWLCRYPDGARQLPGRVHYARMRGAKQVKLTSLAEATRASLGFAPLHAIGPRFRWLPTRVAGREYASYLALDACLSFQREGVQSNRDGLAIARDRRQLLDRLHEFARGHDLPESMRAQVPLVHYDPSLARKRIAEVLEIDPDGRLGLSVRPIAYRPFDDRWFCPVAPLCHRPRPELLQALTHGGFALISLRKDRGEIAWAHSGASAFVADNCYLSTRSSARARVFPSREPSGADNLREAARDLLGERFGMTVDALSFLHYALGCLSAASYRARWDAELRQDYARLPLPLTAAGFARVAACGQRIAAAFVGATSACADDGLPDLGSVHHSELRIHAADGCVRLHGQALWEPGQSALALRVGHHAPLQSYLAARAEEPLDRPSQRALGVQLRRLQELADAYAQAEAVVAAELSEAFAAVGHPVG